MYKVFFAENFFTNLDNFIDMMDRYYINFYRDTWIYDVDLIIEQYLKIYENLKHEIILEIKNISELWLLWRKIIKKDGDIELVQSSFDKRSYSITFFALKNDTSKEVTIYNLKIEKR